MAKKKKKPEDDPKSKKAKAKAKQREEEEDEEEDDEDDSEEESSGKQRVKSGVYVGLGGITLVALITAGVFFYMDAEAHAKPAPAVNVDLIGLNATAPKVAQN